MKIKATALAAGLAVLATPAMFAQHGRSMAQPRNQVGMTERVEKRGVEGIEERTLHARNTTAPNNIVGLHHRAAGHRGHHKALGHGRKHHRK